MAASGIATPSKSDRPDMIHADGSGRNANNMVATRKLITNHMANPINPNTTASMTP